MSYSMRQRHQRLSLISPRLSASHRKYAEVNFTEFSSKRCSERKTSCISPLLCRMTDEGEMAHQRESGGTGRFSGATPKWSLGGALPRDLHRSKTVGESPALVGSMRNSSEETILPGTTKK